MWLITCWSSAITRVSKPSIGKGKLSVMMMTPSFSGSGRPVRRPITSTGLPLALRPLATPEWQWERIFREEEGEKEAVWKYVGLEVQGLAERWAASLSRSEGRGGGGRGVRIERAKWGFTPWRRLSAEAIIRGGDYPRRRILEDMGADEMCRGNAAYRMRSIHRPLISGVQTLLC